ncbi:MAG: AAA family ATPase [Pseudanabaena sp.]
MTKTKSTLKDDQNINPEQGITKISVSGYKSLAEECSIEIAPLTILSGANSSGKSSIMQPLLLMKQTLESTYDAGSLKLNGANVRLTSADQIFTKKINKSSISNNNFSVVINLGNQRILKNIFKKENKVAGIKIFASTYEYKNVVNMSIDSDMKHENILNNLPFHLQNFYQNKYKEEKNVWGDFTLVFESQRIKFIPSSSLKSRFANVDNLDYEYLEHSKDIPKNLPKDYFDLIQKDYLKQKSFEEGYRNGMIKMLDSIYKFSIKTYKCFLYVDSQFLLPTVFSTGSLLSADIHSSISLFRFLDNDGLCKSIEKQIRQLIHIPGLRGNPERTYPVTAVGEEFIGTFEHYVASVINHWKVSKSKKLKQLSDALQTLGLTWKVDTKQIDDTQVEVRVGRLKNKENSQSTDMVSIADVGFGLSQTLPVVVALLVAEPEQLVYLEQPEIHLHPRAQANLAQLLVDAANRGVRVVVETHSELLIRRVQSLIAEDKIDAEKVKLHWFSQDDNGFTKVTTAELDETGAFGDWPEDFSEISLQEESRYLDAAESKLMAV